MRVALRGRASGSRSPAVGSGRPSILAPGGPSSPPAYGSAGALTWAGAGAGTVPYPTGPIAAGDLLVLMTNGTGTLSAIPAGFTLLGPGTLSLVSGYGTRQCRAYWKFADGGESGNLAITRGGILAAVMFRFSNVKSGAAVADFLESLDQTSGANTSPLTHQPITSTGSQRLAVVLGWRGGDNFVTNDMTGETGAAMTERADVGTSAEFNYGFHVFAGTLADAGTVSGGGATTSGIAGGWASQSFALLAAA